MKDENIDSLEKDAIFACDPDTLKKYGRMYIENSVIMKK